MTDRTRVAGRLRAFPRLILQGVVSWLARLARVTVVPVGKANDGLVPFGRSGTDLDKDWGVLLDEFKSAFDAWRKNPLARRLVGIVTAYVLGGDIILLRASSYAPLDKFIHEVVNHPENRFAVRQADWCDELTRAGELFPTLHFNSADGVVYLRAVSASRVERVEWLEQDYEAETTYHEVGDVLSEGEVWYHPRAVPDRDGLAEGAKPKPVMLHYAINRPVGCVRGESDLAPILPWVKRYSRWLEDRVRTNAAHRVFLWIVKVPSQLVKAKEEQYKSMPAAGSVMVVGDNEDWTAVTPSLQARDASPDGRAIRWMVVAGGPGLSLLDLGESETANRASAEVLGAQRRRFLRRRQAYFGFILADVVLQAWNRAVALGLRRGRPATLAQIEVGVPDIAPEDNWQLARAAGQITDAMTKLEKMVGPSAALRRVAARMMFKFAGESVLDTEFEEIVGGAFVDGGTEE